MQRKIVPLDKTLHKNTKLKANIALAHAKKTQVTPIQVHEFNPCATHYPIVFVKDNRTGDFTPVAMFGLKPNENLLCNETGWNSSYIPAVLKSFPFALVPTSSDGENVAVCIDISTDGINEVEGVSLFDENGNETEFTQYLVTKNLLKTFSFSVKSEKSDEYSLTGIYAINLDAFNALSDEEFLTLRRIGYLPAIYAHLTSLNQISNLARLKSLKIEDSTTY
ncbi:MAG: hypothetical protein EOO07_33755 [Chitinophagaceae bacterium]|nr:MAG: hypothetical protein EOO07_33755 [Chitinophagaceae bacterium]